MIYITVGTQLPFDRLIKAVDMHFDSKCSVTAQIGPSKYICKHLDTVDFVTPKQSDAYFNDADLIIAHAGMGSIFNALKFKKPIIVMPRRHELGEHRNDHQVATAKWVSGIKGVLVADDEHMLINLLENFDATQHSVSELDSADDSLLDFIRQEISS